MSALRFLKPPKPAFGHNGASVAPASLALAVEELVNVPLDLFYTAASMICPPMEQLTRKLTFLKNHIDRLINDKGDHAPRQKAKIEMHVCEGSRR